METFFFQLGAALNGAALGFLSVLFFSGPFRKSGKVLGVILLFTAFITMQLLTAVNLGIPTTAGPINVLQWMYVVSLGGIALRVYKALPILEVIKTPPLGEDE